MVKGLKKLNVLVNLNLNLSNYVKICFLARRPPVEETTSFLNSLLASHGPNYLEKLFGRKARNRLAQLGGVDNVAIALSGWSLPQHQN